ncbi:flagellar type III secretion system pore protein FliP [Clostridium botulinum C]|uniref:Flagellar biosynthetic protein FliP n=2 Tax=Clostridium botulinum TaxID=1491 RepID=A0A9Q4TGJ8_CLOBO|nr:MULTISPECIES: flagellar type III secretion system pore protein FliP [Clostridium]EGO87235.1 flagellar biosynthesis protein flip [Clostridium botulinum C str. Stockholm]KEI10642.1 flagellar biosynthesis protein flip [Clostridium sp. K25]MCD3194115.1 flagellar type III secretion system pore protein FliP [Clostridium botulinum C]MCD3199256.1 flagellar type III secretion system pore protein FliP [Clostridium botulinum C]MCD3204731.1 flagellar type III secretion system pore protein FliP [Clostri
MKKRKFSLFILVIFALVILGATKAYAAPDTIPVPKVNISVDKATNPKDYVDNIKLLVMLTVLSLLPSFLVMMTSFTRIIIVLGFMRNALGTQQAPPNQILIGIALFLTIFIMAPTYKTINKEAIKPFLENKITGQQAIDNASKPMREFMLKQTRDKDLELFLDVSKTDKAKITKDNVPMYVVIPSFIISELKTAFKIGFLLYIPFLIIDIVVASVLMSMGMFMLPPVMISLPFKILLFVMVDGWYLLVKSLIMGYSS